MSTDKLFRMFDASEPIKKTKENSNTSKTLEDIEPPFVSENKSIRDIRKKHEADKMLALKMRTFLILF